MTPRSAILAGLAVAALVEIGQAASDDNTFAPWGYDLSARDLSVKPGNDFFLYANGAWLKRTEIPADRSIWGMHAMLAERTLSQLRMIMQDAVKAPQGSIARKVGDYFAAYMNDDRIERLGGTPLAPVLDAVRAAKTRAAMAGLMGRANKDLEGSFISISVSADPKDPDHYVVGLAQGGLGLPERDYYLDASFAAKKDAYRDYVKRQLVLIGWPDAEKNADAIVALETKIAAASWTKVQDRDVQKIYNPTSVADLAKMAPGFDWQSFLSGADLSSVSRVIVAENTAFPKIAEIFADTDIATLQAWQAFNIADNAAMYLSKDFVTSYFEFHGKALAGQQEQKPRWKNAVHAVGGGDILFGQRSEIYGCLLWAVGDLYVEKYFPPAKRLKAVTLVETLKQALRERIAHLDWMGDATKAKALDKLKTLTAKIGSGPDKRDYSRLEIAPDDLLGNARRVGAFEWAILAARPGKTVDRDEWQETPQTVNDYEDPVMNEVAFPAAYLQAPFFDPDADAAVNYGAAGLIAHELTHSFDDQGRKFDATGRLADWWTENDARTFEARIKVFGAQYDAYEVLPGLHVNGDLTMGENIADLGGVLIAYDAYHASLGGKPPPVLDGLTGDQRFFLGWAQVWRLKVREDSIRARIVGDPHSPPGARAEIPLQNIDAWYASFDVKPGERLYLAPAARVKIW